jgi:hypothetical protein
MRIFAPQRNHCRFSNTPHQSGPTHHPGAPRAALCLICRLPKLQKETSNVLQNSQPLPAHPIPVARRHVSRIAGHHKRRDACDTRTTPQLRRYKTNKFHCQPFNFGFTDMSQTKLRPKCLTDGNHWSDNTTRGLSSVNSSMSDQVLTFTSAAHIIHTDSMDRSCTHRGQDGHWWIISS